MAKGILLETRTANFLELIGNGKIYRVPPYQRDYSWKEEQWEDLWNDIWQMRGQVEERHYMGAVVIEGITDREFLIIDGQQRMATLSLLALAVLRQLEDLVRNGVDPDPNKERGKGLRNRFVGEKDPASLIETSKLFLNETDNAFYQDYLVQLRPPLNPRGLPKSNALLWKCFEYFYKQIAAIEDFRSNGAELASLLNETVARQLLFILISVDDELNAYTVFETLNARGLELSSTDLLKNYLFSRIKVHSDLDALQRRWRHLIATVRQERFPEFLRYHLLCKYKQVRSQRLFKMVRDEVRTGEAVFGLMVALEARAELFSACLDSNHEYWIEHPECRPFIRQLNLFGVRQMMPVLFAAWECFSADDFARVLKLLTVVSFRYTVVSGLNSNELEPVYHVAAKSILDAAASRPAEVFEILKAIYVSDDKFQRDFEALEIGTSGRRKKLVKYILTKLEEDVSGRSIDPDTDSASLEHILPENPTSSRNETFPEERWERSVYRLGNLTLLEASANRRVANEPFSDKLTAYEKSTYALTKRIVELAPHEWTPALLENRQKMLAARAVHVWRSDFC